VSQAVSLYLRSLMAHVRAALEYEADFWIMVLAGLLGPGAGLAFVWVVFRQVPELNGWHLPEAVLLYGLISVTEGIHALLFDGAWQMGRLINRGEMDYQLVRPYPVALQVTSSSVGFNGLGDLASGAGMLGWGLAHVAVRWSPATVFVALVLFTSGVTIKVAVTFASNAAAFWLAGPSVLFAVAVHQVGGLARYPLNVYAGTLRLLVSVGIPFAFIGFFPVSYLLGRGHAAWLGCRSGLPAGPQAVRKHRPLS
jgi:viologen exporter family transport system permease protein